MRVLGTLVVVALGVALAGGLQWAAAGGPGLPAALPPWAGPLLPLAAFLIFGAYLVAAYGGTPGPGRGVLGALAALAVAALPLAYAFGLAARAGLPGSGGWAGAWLAGPYARAGAALWLPVALASSFRRPRRRPIPPPPAPEPAPYPMPVAFSQPIGVGAGPGDGTPPA
jgi:hypothetical protein